MNQLWTRRKTLRFIAGAAGGLALHACTPSAQNSTTETVSASIGIFNWVGSVPVFIAQEKGFFKALGLNLDIRVFSANTDGNTAFIAGRIDATSPVGSEAVTLAVAGKDFRIVLVQDISVGGDGILARNSIASIKDFKDKRIAVEEGSVSHFFLLQVLASVGLGAGDFTLVNSGPDAAAAAYQAGQIDIAVTYAPFLAKANAAQKDGRIIYDSSKMPGAITDLYVFDTKFTETNPKAVEAFVRGVFQGLDFLKTNMAEGLAIASQRLGVKPEDLQSQIKGVRLPDLSTNIEMLGNPQSNLYLLKSLSGLAKFLKDQNQIKEIPDMAKLIEPKFVKAIQEKAKV